MAEPTDFSTFDFADPALAADPYPVYAAMRSECPVARSDVRGGFWVVAKYEDCRWGLTSPDLFSSRQTTLPPLADAIGPMIPANLDPPEHTLYRRLLLPLFSPQRVLQYESLARAAARTLLAPIVEKQTVEFIRDFAIPYPYHIFLPFMGLPLDDTPLFLEWEEESLRKQAVDPIAASIAVEVTRPKVIEYFRTRIREKLTEPEASDDLLGFLTHARLNDGRALTENELLRMCILLFQAGLHTTTDVVGNAMCYLSRHLAARDALVTNPEIIPSAVEEFLRYESVAPLGRIATRDVELHGHMIEAGAFVTFVAPSASRDEDEFPDADSVVFERHPNRHLGFGLGPHRCLGAALGRMEFRVALEEIHRMLPSYQLAPGTVPERHVGFLRGTDELWLQTT